MECGAPSDRLHRIAQGVLRHITDLWYRAVERIFEVPDRVTAVRERTMLGKNVVEEELKGLGLSIKEIEPFLRAGGDAAEMKFMECFTRGGRMMMSPAE
jgi:hypothetical protein